MYFVRKIFCNFDERNFKLKSNTFYYLIIIDCNICKCLIIVILNKIKFKKKKKKKLLKQKFFFLIVYIFF